MKFGIKLGVPLLAAAGLLSGCASDGIGHLANQANSNFAGNGIAVTAEAPSRDVGSQGYPSFATGSEPAVPVMAGGMVMMPGQGSNGMPQSLNSLPVGAADMP